MNLLIVGGAGFIGLNYVRALAKGNLKGVDNITVVDSFTYASNRKQLYEEAKTFHFEVIELDITEREQILSLSNSFDAVINFAAESHVDRSISDATPFLKTNVLGLQNLLDLARKRKIRLLQISTDEVYGSIIEESWDESCRLLPNSPYAASKASGDLLVRSYINTFGLEAVVTRSSNNYGPYQNSEKFIPKSIINLSKGISVPVYGTGNYIREWLYVEDNIAGIHKVLFQGLSGSIYNLGSPYSISNIDLFHLICDVGNFDSNLISHVEDRPGHDYRYSLDYRKALREVNFQPRIDLRTGLEMTIEWYMNNISIT